MHMTSDASCGEIFDKLVQNSVNWVPDPSAPHILLCSVPICCPFLCERFHWESVLELENLKLHERQVRKHSRIRWFQTCLCLSEAKGHLIHVPRAVPMKLWEPKRKCPKAVLRHFPKSCSVVTAPSVVWSHMWLCPQPKCYFNKFYSCGSSQMVK
jgi:hypothetical protein